MSAIYFYCLSACVEDKVDAGLVLISQEANEWKNESVKERLMHHLLRMLRRKKNQINVKCVVICTLIMCFIFKYVLKKLSWKRIQADHLLWLFLQYMHRPGEDNLLTWEIRNSASYPLIPISVLIPSTRTYMQHSMLMRTSHPLPFDHHFLYFCFLYSSWHLPAGVIFSVAFATRNYIWACATGFSRLLTWINLSLSSQAVGAAGRTRWLPQELLCSVGR